MLLQEIKQLDLQPTVACFNTTLTAYANAMEWEAALQLFLSMEEGLNADVVSLSTLSQF